MTNGRKLIMNTALLIIDMQNDYFLNGAMQLANIESAAENAASILKYFRKSNKNIFHIQHISKRAGAGFFIENTKGAEIHSSVYPLKNEYVIIKNYPNSFRETVLLEKLKKNSIENLIICGAMSHMCIDATTRAAFDLSFKCTVIEDACATRNLCFKDKTVKAEEVHSAFMSALGAVYANIMTTEEFFQSNLK